MGVLFIEYPKSDRYFACKKCDTPIGNFSLQVLFANNFFLADACNENVAVDHRNRTYLFQKFVNTKQGNSYTKNEIRNIMVIVLYRICITNTLRFVMYGVWNVKAIWDGVMNSIKRKNRSVKQNLLFR